MAILTENLQLPETAAKLAPPAFSRTERDRRWNLARELMDENQVDALIVYGSREGAFPAPYSMDTYFTNDRPGAIVVFPRHGEPMSLAFVLALNDHLQARMRHEETWIRPENMFGGAPNGEGLVHVLRHAGLAKSALGVLGLDPYPPFYFDGPMPYHTWKTVLDELPEARFKPLGRQFFQKAAARSPEELEVLKWSAGVGEMMCEAMLEATYAGASEAEIYAAAVSACPRHVGFTGEVLLNSGKEFVSWGPPTWTYRPHQPRTIQQGDVVAAEVFCSLGMLETQHQPTITVGRVHPDYERAANIARASYEAGLEALRPGRTFGEVVEAMRKPLEKSGGWNVHPLIHGINPYGTIGEFGDGFAKLPEAQQYARAGVVPTHGAEVEIQPGMTFSFEPSCALGKRFVNLGGTVIAGATEAIQLNRITTYLMRA